MTSLGRRRSGGEILRYSVFLPLPLAPDIDRGVQKITRQKTLVRRQVKDDLNRATCTFRVEMDLPIACVFYEFGSPHPDLREQRKAEPIVHVLPKPGSRNVGQLKALFAA